MLLDERGSLWIPFIGVQQELWCSIKTCVRVNVSWRVEEKEERRGEKRGWTETSKVAGGRNNTYNEMHRCDSIIKASNMWSKDNFNSAGA